MTAKEEKVTAFSKLKWKIISLILQPFLHRKRKKKHFQRDRTKSLIFVSKPLPCTGSCKKGIWCIYFLIWQLYFMAVCRRIPGLLWSRKGIDCGVVRDEKKRKSLSYSLYDLNVMRKIRVDRYFHSTKQGCVLNLDLLT